jgi:hypothetical protein
MNMKANKTLLLLLGVTLILGFAACTRHGVNTPDPTGPSTYGIVLKVSASPNVLLAGDSRESATITAVLKNWDGSAVANRTVYFEINDSLDRRASIGYLEGHKNLVAKTTDGGGNAVIGYYAPIKSEIKGNTIVHIWVSVAMEGNTFIQDFAELAIIR